MKWRHWWCISCTMVEFARALTWELFGNFASEREKWRGIGEAMVHGRVNDWAQRSSSDGKDTEMSYNHLASESKVTLESGKFAFDVDRLQIYTGKQVFVTAFWILFYYASVLHPSHGKILPVGVSVLLLLMFQILKVQIVTLDRI
ncbi:hypothetical protein RND71_022754 [Anisodus tanguticus]|uniref:Uncharacterized protein n=1 Tax=Anisodus tanguticus TaxID=243964 RepID=A0AAE1VD82_9SOLA|nr:hypothetical protein RND71_022754 [Anisodus tanguticus]